ncbi:hypothetical protein M0811_11466 [Anaeramoeba ignava]|uniref:PH domain-containing protein n=1 Tax=Anaeramoeba ignava TaxID=1746090 RepID=A0A9Q0R7F1_ANAIG|nr:hypothetical protein M0811_11466 [Anaeramoeba ignava]
MNNNLSFETNSLLNKIKLNPDISILKQTEQENINQLSSYEILIRWVNFQAVKSGQNNPVRNLGKDLSDSITLSYVLAELEPEINFFETLMEPLKQRASTLLDLLHKTNYSGMFCTPEDITSGNEDIIVTFLMELFLWRPTLTTKKSIERLQESIEELTKEKEQNYSPKLEDLLSQFRGEVVKKQEPVLSKREQILSQTQHLESFKVKVSENERKNELLDNEIENANNEYQHLLEKRKKLEMEINQKEKILNEEIMKKHNEQKLKQQKLKEPKYITFLSFVENSNELLNEFEGFFKELGFLFSSFQSDLPEIQDEAKKLLKTICDVILLNSENMNMPVSTKILLKAIFAIINKNTTSPLSDSGIEKIRHMITFLDPKNDSMIFHTLDQINLTLSNEKLTNKINIYRSLQALFNNFYFSQKFRNAIIHKLLSLFPQTIQDPKLMKEMKRIVDLQSQNSFFGFPNFELVEQSISSFLKLQKNMNDSPKNIVQLAKKKAIGKTIRMIIRRIDKRTTSEFGNKESEDSEIISEDSNPIKFEKRKEYLSLFLNEDDFDFFIEILSRKEPISYIDSIAENLFDFLEPFGVTMPVIKTYILEEVFQGENPRSLFQTMNVGTKILLKYILTYSGNYLKDSLSDFIEKLSKTSFNLEVDPKKPEYTSNQNQLLERFSNIKQLFGGMFQQVINSKESIPIEIQVICYYFKNITLLKFAKDESLFSVGIFFLHILLSNVLQNPQDFEISKVQLTQHIKRILYIFSIILQNLSKGASFENETEYLSPLNDLLLKYMFVTREFFISISEIPKTNQSFSENFNIEQVFGIDSKNSSLSFLELFPDTELDPERFASEFIEIVYGSLSNNKEFFSPFGVKYSTTISEKVNLATQNLSSLNRSFASIQLLLTELGKILSTEKTSENLQKIQTKKTNKNSNENEPIKNKSPTPKQKKEKPKKVKKPKKSQVESSLLNSWLDNLTAPTEKEAFIQHKNKKLGWKKRYIVLKSYYLAVFQKNNDDLSSPIDVIFLDTETRMFFAKPSDSKKKNSFVLVPKQDEKDRTIISCENKQDVVDWLSILRKSRNKVRKDTFNQN